MCSYLKKKTQKGKKNRDISSCNLLLLPENQSNLQLKKFSATIVIFPREKESDCQVCCAKRTFGGSLAFSSCPFDGMSFQQ